MRTHTALIAALVLAPASAAAQEPAASGSFAELSGEAGCMVQSGILTDNTYASGEEALKGCDKGRGLASAIRSCSLLAAVLDGQEVDSGVAAEVGYACALGIPCFGLRTDLRTSGEAEVTVNLQVEYFLQESGGRLVSTLDALIDALARGV